MMKFKVGDKVRGTSDSYFYTNKNMSLGEVVNVTPFEIEIKIIEHSDSSQVGEVYWAVLPKGKFELVEEKKMNKFEELENKIKELASEIERLKVEEENEPWKPKDGDKYWLISHNGYVVQVRWMGDEAEDDIYAIGNVFRTQEEAEFRAEQLKVEAELRRFARPFEENKSNWAIMYDVDDKEITTGNYRSFQNCNINFASEQLARKAIAAVGEERIKKYYFGVED